jgi:hypothetical protein
LISGAVGDYVTENRPMRESAARPTSVTILQEPRAPGRQHSTQLLIPEGATMTTQIEATNDLKVYTTADGRVTIEQSSESIVVLSADQIVKVIKELHACYDYCAAWKEPT